MLIFRIEDIHVLLIRVNLVLVKRGEQFVPSPDGGVGVLDLVNRDLHLSHAVAAVAQLGPGAWLVPNTHI